MRSLFFTSLFSVVCMCCWAGDNADENLNRMQGTWQVVSLTERGKDIPKSEIDLLEVITLKDRFSVSEKGKVVVLYRIKLDPGKMPKSIDFVHLAGNKKDKTEPGIYTFEKDQLKLVLDEDSKGRPAGFGKKETASCSVLVLKKKPPGKESKKKSQVN